MVERLLDVVQRLRGQPLAGQHVGYPRRVRGQRLGGHPPDRLAHRDHLLAARGTPRAASSPARPKAAAARTPRPPGRARGRSSSSTARRSAATSRSPAAAASSPIPNTATITFSPASSTCTSSLLAQHARQLVAARPRAAHVDGQAAAGRRRTRRAPRPAARRARRGRAPRARRRAWPPAPRSVSASSAAAVDRRGAPGAVERRAQQRVRAGRLDERHAAVDHVLVEQVAVRRGAPSPTGSGCRRSCGCSRSPGPRPATARAPAARR